MRLKTKRVNINNLGTSTAVSAANKITNDGDHDKYIAAKKFNKLRLENFTTRLKRAHLASQSDSTNFVRKGISK